MKFPDYLNFKHYIWENYSPLPSEITPIEEGFQPGTNWAKRGAPRFFRALKVIDELTASQFSLIDVGSYPGSFTRLAQRSFGESITELYACGMAPDKEFENCLAAEGISFLHCNLDPDIKSSLNIHEGIPLPDNSVDCIVLMEIVEHLYSLKTIILESYRVLKPNGICYITTNNIADRLALLRLVCRHSTNLDEDLKLTSIWSDYKSIHRGHVRFFSLNQLAEVGIKAGFKIEKSGYFQHYEDPDVYIRQDEDNKLLEMIKRKLRGNGTRPPIWLTAWAKSIFHLGIKSLDESYSSHLEIVYRKPSS